MLVVAVFYCCIASVLTITSEITKHPKSQLSLVGSKVTFSCRISNLPAHGDVVQWTRNGSIIVKDGAAELDRYSITGDHSQGHYDLTISNIQLEDEAEFKCQGHIKRPAKVQQLNSKSANLTVIIPPKKHAVLGLDSDNKYKVVNGKDLNVSCTSYDSKPQAKLNWLIDGKKVLQDKLIKTEITSRKFKGFSLYNTTSYLMLNKNHFKENKKITCQLEPLFQTLKYENITFLTKLINIPKAQMFLTSNHSNGSVNEKSTVVFKCVSSDERPHVLNYKWFKNEKLIKEEKTGIYKIEYIDRNWNNVTFSCCIQNEAGCSKIQSHKIDVKYAPVLTTYSKDILVESGKSVSLFCNWDGNPKPLKTTWTKKGLYAVLSESSSLNINNVTQNQAGIYNCNAESRIGSSSQSITVKVLGKPIISNTRVQNVQPNENAIITCNIATYPGIQNIKWEIFHSKKSFELQDNDFRNDKSGVLKYKSILNSTGFSGKLEIYNVNDDDFDASYNCVVENIYGKSSKLFYLSPILDSTNEVSKNSILVIAGSSVGVFLFISIVCAAVYCFIKKRSKKLNKFKEKDQLQYNEDIPGNNTFGGSLNVSAAKFSTESSNNHSFLVKDLTSSQISSIHSCSSHKNNDDGYSTGGASQNPLTRRPSLATPEPVPNNLTSLSPLSRLHQLSYGFPGNKNSTSFTHRPFTSDNVASDEKYQRRCSSATEEKQVFIRHQTPSPILHNYFLGSSKVDPKSMGDGVNFVSNSMSHKSSKIPPQSIDMYSTPDYPLFIAQQAKAQIKDSDKNCLRPYTPKRDDNERMSTLV